MAKATVEMPDDFIRKCAALGSRTDEVMGEVLKAREEEKAETRTGRVARRARSKAESKLVMPGKIGIGLARGNERTAKRILELLADGPMSPSALREAVGIRSRIHFSRYYLTPLVKMGLIARTDPENPMSPRQEYKLV